MTKHLEDQFVFPFKCKYYHVIWKGSFTYDSAFNADADGNRGIGVWLEETLEYSVMDAIELTAVDDLEILIEAEKLLTNEVDKKILEEGS
jgi:hypothetical protein